MGQTLIRKLGQKVKDEDKKCVKLEEVAEPSNRDYESQQPSFDSKSKGLLFIKKETQPVQNKAPAETLMDQKILFKEKVAVEEEDTKVQQRIPMTILFEDEGYLLEGDEVTINAKSRVVTHRKFYSQEDKTERPKKKKIKVKSMEFSIVGHQGKSLKMMGELSSGWRPKNKLRLNMKKILNPKLNTTKVTMIDTSSSDEKIESSKGDFKGKKALKSIEESSLTDTKLSAVFLELRAEMLKEQQREEMEASYSENKLLMDENAPAETDNQENPSVHDTSTELLPEDEEIFRKPNIPWLPSELQNTTGSKAFDSEKGKFAKNHQAV